VRGRCERTVTFLALDGRPFACAQDLHYRLRAEYRFDAHLDPDGSLAVIEREYRAAPSPCDSGERRLTGYRGRLLHRDQLQLRWADGEQTLRRVHPPEPSPTDDATPQPIAGAWRWSTRNRRDAEVRVESEDWQLEHNPDTGVLTGAVERTVTVFEEDGARYPCSDDTLYRYRDRYTVRGVAGQAGVSLTETAVEPESHPCLESRERHLDAATGAIVGDYLVLTWRGGKHQVLHRPLIRH
jgi:hypothetical protein